MPHVTKANIMLQKLDIHIIQVHIGLCSHIGSFLRTQQAGCSSIIPRFVAENKPTMQRLTNNAVNKRFIISRPPLFVLVLL